VVSPVSSDDTQHRSDLAPNTVSTVVSPVSSDDIQHRSDVAPNIVSTVVSPVSSDNIQHRSDLAPNTVSDVVSPGDVDVEPLTLSGLVLEPTASCSSSDPVQVSDTIYGEDMLTTSQQSSDRVSDVDTDMTGGNQSLCDVNVAMLALNNHSSGPATSRHSPDQVQSVVSDTICDDEMLSISHNCSNNIATRSDRMDLTTFKPPEKRKQQCMCNDELIAMKCLKSTDGLSHGETYDSELSSSAESVDNSLVFNSASCLTASDTPDVEMISNIVAGDGACHRALYHDVLSKLTESGLPDETPISIPIGTLIFILNSGTHNTI